MISEIYYVLAFMILHTEKGIKNVIIKNPSPTLYFVEEGLCLFCHEDRFILIINRIWE